MTRPPLASAPRGPVDVPGRVTLLAAGDEITPVWRNEAGGVTFRLGDSRFVKFSAATSFDEEIDRLNWARPFISVPEVLDSGRDDEGSWLVTRALPGISAVDRRWDVATAVRAMGVGLRVLHDALPVEDCPFDWSIDERLARAGHPSFGDRPSIARPVVCHGDACAPNTLIGPNGDFAGHVDLGRMGVADAWADLAVASWSLEWNVGPGFDELFYDAYGIAEDPERVAFYRLLWDAT